MSEKSSRRILIPAAGYGTRVGSPGAKEMMPRPAGLFMAGEPMISFSLHLAKITGAKPHVITRDTKRCQTLLGSAIASNSDATMQIVAPTREWPDTLLHSRDHWLDVNIVCLPDTDFSPVSVIEDMFSALESSADVVFATFTPEGGDFKTWGVVSADVGLSARHCEKPVEWDATTQAWGIFGFRREFGARLLEQMLESTFDHQWRSLTGRVSLLPLEHFRDLTRG